MTGSTPRPDRTAHRIDPRALTLVAVLVAAVLSGFAASVSAAPTLPACRVGDVLTKYGSYTTWNRSLLDMTYRLASTYKPGDLRSTAYAGLNGGYLVRRLVLTDLRAMASAARA